MPAESSSSVVVKSVDPSGVRQAMDRWASELLARPEVREVVVFGSFEQGSYAPGSDLDVLIVLDDSSVSLADRAAEYRPLRFPVPIDLFAFTRAELERRLATTLGRAIQGSRWRYSNTAAGKSVLPGIM